MLVDGRRRRRLSSAGRIARRPRSTVSSASWGPTARPGATCAHGSPMRGSRPRGEPASRRAGDDRGDRPRERFGQGALATPANLVTLLRARRRGPDAHAHPRIGASWMTVGAVVRDHVDRQPRRLARPPRRRDALGRVPRSRRRQVHRHRRARRARGSGRLSPGGRGASSWRARSASRSIARSRPARHRAAGERLGKYKAFSQYCAVGFVLLPITADWEGVPARRPLPRGGCSPSCPGWRSSGTVGSTSQQNET